MMKSSDIGIEFPVVGVNSFVENNISIDNQTSQQVKSRIIDLVRYTLSKSQLDNSSFDWDFFNYELNQIIK